MSQEEDDQFQALDVPGEVVDAVKSVDSGPPSTGIKKAMSHSPERKKGKPRRFYPIAPDGESACVFCVFFNLCIISDMVHRLL